MNIGKYIFAQVIDFIPRYQFGKLVKQYNGDWHAKDLTCYSQLLHLLFDQLSGCDSIRDICLCLKAHESSLYHLGFCKSVTHTSLSRANENRDYRIYEGLGQHLIALVRPLYANTPVLDVNLDNLLYALDSTTISTSIKLASWAFGKYSKGAVKMHTLLDLRGTIPANIHITDGKWHDSNELDELVPEPLAFYMMDKAYVDFAALYTFHKAGAYWVSRPKDNMKYEVVEFRSDFDSQTGINADFTIRLTTYKSKKLYPDLIRLVSFHDKETGNNVEFISNNFEISAYEISVLYRHRWDIEVFFKWVKQNIVVKTLWGYSENAVRTHLWVAVVAYLIIARIKAECKSPYSVTEGATLIRISILSRENLRELITSTKVETKPIQNFKERTLFDDI